MEFDRPTILLLIALGLLGYGIYAAVHLPAMVVGPPMPLLLVGFLAQAVFALAAAVGVWRDRPWGALAVILLGLSIAATALVEAFILGIVAWLWALLVAIMAIAVALLIAAYVSRGAASAA
jgi:hypothetical protein